MQEILVFVLTAPTDVAGDPSFEAFWAAYLARAARWTSPFDRAVAGGFAADRVSLAFAAGYHAALRELAPSIPDETVVALCATEAGGAHPRAIRTALVDEGDRLVLRGKKQWATLAQAASELLVVASTGEDASGKNRLRVVRIAARAPGVTILSLPPHSVAPEIPHAQVELRDVSVAAEDVLPGDGYDDYLKPFRTIEDIHVHGALLGYLLSAARRHGAGEASIARLTAALVSTRALAELDPRAPAVHVALAGVLDEVGRIAADSDAIFGSSSPAAGERVLWDRDRGLLGVAQRARDARRARAFAALFEPRTLLQRSGP